ncbi:MAG: hypothetical protein K1X92_08645 [Bacteroidia bacterium]|nr:hypothetical protein [Bacteroidia bacterium]
MSEISRLKRLAKSLISSLNKSRSHYYSFEDAKMAINELGMSIPPDLLAKLLDSDSLLDDFLSNLYTLEDDYGKPVLNASSAIIPELQPKVYAEGQRIAFTVTYGTFRKQEVIFAEYNFGEPYFKEVNVE